MLRHFYTKRLNNAGYVVLMMDKLDAERHKNQEEKTALEQQLKTLRRENEAIYQEHEAALGKMESLHDEQEQLQKEIDALEQERAVAMKGNFEQMLQNPNSMYAFVTKLILGPLGRHHRSVFWGDRLLTLDKAAGFYEDETFKTCVQQINRPGDYDQYAAPDGIAWRLNTLVWAAKHALNLPGDFMECGVFKGDMSWVVINAVGWEKVDKTFFLYDTFEGFAPEYTSQEDFPLNPGFLEFANTRYQIPGLYEQVCERFNAFANIKVIKGVLPDVLDTESPKQIAFLHIDLNAAKPEIGVLEAVFDRIVPGGIVVLDDYGWLEYIRQKRAEDDFMHSRGYAILELPTGQGLVIKRS